MKIDLLSVEEAKKLPTEILQCKAPKYFDGYMNKENGNCRWWLRSQGYYSDFAAVMRTYGDVYRSGDYVNYKGNAVRPAFRIDESLIKRLPKTKKGYINFIGTKWIDISEYVGSPCLLKKKCLKKAHRFDSKSNNYEESEIKKIIDDWYIRKVKKCYGEK